MEEIRKSFQVTSSPIARNPSPITKVIHLVTCTCLDTTVFNTDVKDTHCLESVLGCLGIRALLYWAQFPWVTGKFTNGCTLVTLYWNIRLHMPIGKPQEYTEGLCAEIPRSRKMVCTITQVLSLLLTRLGSASLKQRWNCCRVSNNLPLPPVMQVAFSSYCLVFRTGDTASSQASPLLSWTRQQYWFSIPPSYINLGNLKSRHIIHHLAGLLW